MDHTEPLPADVLANILRRLEPRWLAVSRCVRKAWRAAVDDSRLLRADLLPLSMSGIFCVAHDAEFPPYLSRPPHQPVGADFRYLRELGYTVTFVISDHCNGLLLVDEDLMVNPATRRCERLPYTPDLPPCTRHKISHRCNLKEYIAFDPAISPHYEVFLIHKSCPKDHHREAEWPPSSYTIRVFSSSTRRWEDRTFIREGGAAGATADMVSDGQLRWYYSAYWRGSLYVRQHDFVMRITSSSNTYRVTKLPRCTFSLETDTISDFSDYRLGKSKKGVYCALVVSRFNLFIWFLDESRGKMEWILRKEVNLEPLLANLPMKEIDGPWRQNVHSKINEAPREEELEWDSDDDNVSETQEGTKDPHRPGGVSILGFHPTKEIVFLLRLCSYRVLAYHVNSSKIEDLGRVRVQYDVISSFPFTPCLMGDL